MKTLKQSLIFFATSLLFALPSWGVTISTNNMGEALIYPYYIARDGQSSLLQIVNHSEKAKAVKVYLREGLNGAVVYSFNLFLDGNDVWTAVVMTRAGLDGAFLFTNDMSCSAPISVNQPLSNRNYQQDAAPFRSLDRVREGYVEVFEMATIERSSALGQAIAKRTTTFRDRPSELNNNCDGVTSAAKATNASELGATSGGLSGVVTLVGDAMSTSFDAIALNGLAIQPGITPHDALLPDWSSVNNKTAILIDDSNSANPQLITARFDRGLDAVSAVLMARALEGEYAFDQTLRTDWLVAFPTKRHYVNGEGAVAPFERKWSETEGRAKVAIDPISFTREAVSSLADGCFATAPDFVPPTVSWSATTFRFADAPNATSDTYAALRAKNVETWVEYSRCGNGFAIQDKRGGGRGLLYLVPYFDGPIRDTHRLVSRADSTRTALNTGTITTGSLTFYGLPAVGVALSAAKFPSAKQENFNSSNALRAVRLIR